VTYNPNGEPGNRITDIKVNGETLAMDAVLNVATNDWIAGGGDDYTMVPALFETTLPLAHPEITSLTDAVIWYMGTNPEIPAGVGRIVQTASVSDSSSTTTPKTGNAPITVTIAVIAVSALGMAVSRKKRS
jgi:2',3'-cyclic-nucleotide 2'-phosphodiesterase (5'-nucleotidase family)